MSSKKMWPDAWGVRMEHILRNVLMALLEQPDSTLHEVLRMLTDSEFRKKIAKSVRNDTVRTFLPSEFERFSFGYRADGTAPIQNKVGAFLADPLLNQILTAPEKDLHIRRIMDQGQVLLCQGPNRGGQLLPSRRLACHDYRISSVQSG
jgi:hypothetical protein